MKIHLGFIKTLLAAARSYVGFPNSRLGSDESETKLAESKAGFLRRHQQFTGVLSVVGNS